MKNKDYIIRPAVLLLGLILLTIIGILFPIAEEARSFLKPEYYFLELTIYFAFILFGVLIEWKAIRKIINQDISLNFYLLSIAIILLAYMVIPTEMWILKYGMNTFTIALMLPHIRTAISILIGIIIVRALVKDK